MKIWKGLASTFLAVLLVGSATAAGGGTGAGKLTLAATGVTADSTFEAAKSASGRIAQTDPSLLGRTDSTEVSVLVKYDYDATASYAGGIAGLEATSPAATGKKLKANRSAVRAYERHAARVSSDITAAVESAVPSADVGRAFTTVYGGVAATVPANKVADLLAVDGVVAVQADTLQKPQTDTTPAFLGATDVWESLGGDTTAGEGVIVGVLDTGVWPEHPSFADHGIDHPGGTYGCEFGDGTDAANLGPAFTCNDKLIGAYAFLDTYLAVIGALPGEYCNATTDVCSARDAEGHGTHTASTAAGSHVHNAPVFGRDRGPISGIAPGAHVIAYRVCLEEGCFSSDSMAAVDQAIVDGVDVINFSISGGASAYTDPVELAFLDAFNAGISVNASVGNAGPGAATANHGGPWVTAVGASTSDRFFTSTLTITDGPAMFTMQGVSIFPNTTGPLPVVLASTLPGPYTATCLTPLPPGAATGKIVACERGVNGRVEKGYNVMQGGAAGMLLYNPVMQDLETDNHWVPTVHVDGPKAALVAFLTAHPTAVATWGGSVASPTQADVMAYFSSRGPLGDFIKPDVTAPGLQILAGMTPGPRPGSVVPGPAGQYFQAIAGTSMSSPHSAGVSALVKAVHPDWSPAMIKSALMTSAATEVTKEDYATPATPFDDGAGSIRANRAVEPTLVFDETFENFVASAGDPLHRIDLNLASVNAPTMTGTITTMRTAINVTGKDQQLEVSTEAPDGATIVVSDKAPDAKGKVKAAKHVHLKKNGTTTFWITISAPELANGQYFGEITLDPKKKGANEVVMPVAFFRKQGDATLTHVCTPTTFPTNASSHCIANVANFSNEAADVTLTVTNLDKGKGLAFKNVTAPATSIKKDDGVLWTGTLDPNLPPSVDSITATSGPGGGYLPLSAFGIGPIGGVGDDTISNFNVPPFYFGGEMYTRIGVVSNGYVVFGGGTSADIVFTPQTFPNPARPNNVVALLWSDLNPAAAGAIRIGVLTDGTMDWLVIDWNGVRNFSNTTTHTFQTWIRTSAKTVTGPASEEVTMTYGVANTASPDPGSGGNSGAENRTGSSGANLTTPANDTEWAVNTSPPQPGGTATIEYDASAKKAGTYRSVAAMTSNVTPGTTQVVQTLTATKP